MLQVIARRALLQWLYAQVSLAASLASSDASLQTHGAVDSSMAAATAVQQALRPPAKAQRQHLTQPASSGSRSAEADQPQQSTPAGLSEQDRAGSGQPDESQSFFVLGEEGTCGKRGAWLLCMFVSQLPCGDACLTSGEQPSPTWNHMRNEC